MRQKVSPVSENPVVANLWSLMRGLRRLNFDLGLDDLQTAVIALEAVGSTRESTVRDVLRAVWCNKESDFHLFDLAFLEWLMLLRHPEPGVAVQETYLANIARRRRQQGGVFHPTWLQHQITSAGDSEASITVVQGATEREIFQSRRLDRLSDQEMQYLLWLYRPKRPLTRPSYLPRAADRGREWSPGETMRRGREGSEWVRLYYYRTQSQPMELTLLLDMSGSTVGYHRALLQFAHAMMRHERGLKVYAFSTRIAVLTRALRHFHIDRALAEASDLTPYRGGGTRIAHSLQELWERERGRGVSVRSTLVLISDGLEDGTGEPVDRWIERWERYLNGRVHWWNPFAVRDPQNLRAPSAAALARHTHYRCVPNFQALTEAWSALDMARAL